MNDKNCNPAFSLSRRDPDIEIFANAKTVKNGFKGTLAYAMEIAESLVPVRATVTA